MVIAVWATRKKKQKHSNSRLGKSVRLPLSALTPSEDILTLTFSDLTCSTQNADTRFLICSNLAYVLLLFP